MNAFNKGLVGCGGECLRCGANAFWAEKTGWPVTPVLGLGDLFLAMNDVDGEVDATQQEVERVSRFIDIMAARFGCLGRCVQLRLDQFVDECLGPIGVVDRVIEFGRGQAGVLSDHAHGRMLEPGADKQVSRGVVVRSTGTTV